MISILIADDDLNKISSIINSIHENFKDQVEIMQASNVQEALEVMQVNHFHLLISDLFMPLRNGDPADRRGGEVLIREIYKRKNRARTPIYIIGLTQFDDVKHNFSGVWKVWKYDSTNEDWKLKLRDLLFHISRVDSKIVKEKKESIFVEGTSDRDILNLAFQIFFKDYRNKVSIETIRFGAGSSWVERQLVIWGKTLFRKDNGEYLQAVGLFDGDKAGKSAIDSLKSQIVKDSAESSTFSVLTLDKKYAKHLIPAYSGGITLPIAIEEMYAPFCWKFAKQQNWLVQRNLSEDLLQDPKRWDKTNQSLREYLESLALSDQVNIFLNYKINDEYKGEFVKYIAELSSENQILALSSFQPLINDILVKLKILDHSF
jgi:CheY-like chemotaxis protein